MGCEIFQFLIFRIIRSLCQPHHQSSYDCHIDSGIFFSCRLIVLSHDDIQFPMGGFDAPMIDLAFEQCQWIAVCQIGDVIHRFRVCRLPSAVFFCTRRLFDDGDIPDGIERTASGKGIGQESRIDQSTAFIFLDSPMALFDKGTVRQFLTRAVVSFSCRFGLDYLRQVLLVGLHRQKIMCLLF